MRQIIESIEQAQHSELYRLYEGYDERVQSAVDTLKKEFPDGVMKKEFEQNLEMINKKYDLKFMELRPTVAGLDQKVGDSRKEFLQDVASKIKFVRDTSKAQKKKARVQEVLAELSYIIDDAVGMSFPDGDPFDHIFPQARKLGIPADDVLSWLDRATRLGGMGKSYHDYLRALWDDQYDDAKSDYETSPEDGFVKGRYNMMGGDNYQNPWGSGK